MAIHAQSTKASNRPRKRTTTRSLAITQLEPKRLGWNGLTAVIIERAMIEEQAQSCPPERAKKLRASGAAVRLEQQERQLWTDLCSAAAEDVLGAPVTKEGSNSRRSRLMPIVESRLRRMFTDATSALLPAALLAGPELRPEKKIARPRKSAGPNTQSH
jgi:hypothetical protein